jgi:hypothetical protein
MSEKGGGLDQAYALDGPKHPLLQRLKEVTAENEAERQSYEQLMDELSKKKMAFEELKVGGRIHTQYIHYIYAMHTAGRHEYTDACSDGRGEARPHNSTFG